MSREGPRVTVVATCSGCDYCKSESYRVQGDSGHDVYCDYGDRRTIGDTNWSTPDWCPLGDRMRELRKLA